MDNQELYRLYSEENHKYNALVWQFPSAILALNILALDKVVLSPLSLLLI